VRAAFAKLIDHFHLRPWEIRKLTDRQIQELYFHPRDDQGEIELPDGRRGRRVLGEPDAPGLDEQPVTLEQHLMHVDLLAARRVITRENADECKQKLREKWAAAGAGDDGKPD
jgi:hypothetical protein